jgi:hypothetical protein
MITLILCIVFLVATIVTGIQATKKEYNLFLLLLSMMFAAITGFLTIICVCSSVT